MSGKLEHRRESHRRRAWDEAYQSLSDVDHASPLGISDLEMLVTAAYLSG